MQLYFSISFAFPSDTEIVHCLYQVIFSNACWYGFSLLIIHYII